jgi:hypothetical protein
MRLREIAFLPAMASLGALAPDPAWAQLCAAGSFSPTGEAPCTAAPIGSFVPTVGATSATLALPGFFVPTTGQSSATPAPPGSFVNTFGATSPTLAGPGTFVPTSGQSSATDAPPGSFVNTFGATSATLAGLGTFVPTSGQTSATEALPGSFVNTFGATSATLALPGFFVPTSGQSSATAAPAGTYVPLPGAATAIDCPGGVGGSFSYGAATACRAGSFDGDGTVGPNFASNFDPDRVIALSAAGLPSVSLDIFNSALELGSQPALTDLTLLSFSFSGADPLAFELIGFTPGTVLQVGGGIASLTVSFGPVPPGLYSSTLTFLTDQGASIGEPGQSFSFQLSGNAAVATPEPGTLGLLGGFVAGLAVLRRRLTRRAG